MFLYKIGTHYFDVIDKKFIEECDINTKKRYNLQGNPIEVIQKIRSEKNKQSMYIVLTVTTKCNLSCDYCFENSINRHTMKQDDLDNVLKAIKKYLIDNRIMSLNCTLFGGEPMLEMEKVFYIVKELSTFCSSNLIKVSFSMTTNGILYDREYLTTLYNFGLKTIQITFDGTHDINNARRKHKSNSIDVYKSILKNLNGYLKIFDKVNIKFNFDKENMLEFPAFLRDITNTVIPEYLKKIVFLIEAIQQTHDSPYKSGFANTDRELAMAYISIVKELLEYGLNYKSKVFNTPCMATAKNSYLIDPDGNCACCISNFIDNELRIGNFPDIDVSKSIEKREEYNRIQLLEKHCKECAFLAGCWGGCLYELSVSGKDPICSLNCRKQFYETYVQCFYEEIFLKKGVDRIG